MDKIFRALVRFSDSLVYRPCLGTPPSCPSGSPPSAHPSFLYKSRCSGPAETTSGLWRPGSWCGFFSRAWKRSGLLGQIWFWSLQIQDLDLQKRTLRVPPDDLLGSDPSCWWDCVRPAAPPLHHRGRVRSRRPSRGCSRWAWLTWCRGCWRTPSSWSGGESRRGRS